MENPQALHALLEETSWMQALARRLVADPHLAADLAQDVALDALEGQPEPGRPLRGWLATVMRRRLSRLRRGEARRVAREQAAHERAPRAAEASVAEVVERAETHRNVVLALLALPEPTRSTLLLRFFEQLPYEEIARRTGVATATVNSRVTRGLDELRRRLESSYAGDRRALALALTPLAKPPAGLATTTILGLKTMHMAIGTAAATFLAVTVSVAVLGGGPGDGEREARPPRPADTGPETGRAAGTLGRRAGGELLAAPGAQAEEPAPSAEAPASLDSHGARALVSLPEPAPEPGAALEVWTAEVEHALVLAPTVASLTVNTGGGDVTVRAAETGQLRIRATVHARLDQTAAHQRTRAFTDHVAVREEDGRLIVEDAHARERGWAVDLELSVPGKLPLFANSGSGDVIVRTGQGRVVANTGSGDVRVELPQERVQHLTASSGSGDVAVEVGGVEETLEASSGAGDVEVRVRGAVSPGRARLSSGSGDVALALPEDARVTLDLETHGGDIRLPDALGLRVERDPRGARVARGTVGGGAMAGGAYELRSGSGDLSVALAAPSGGR